MKLEIMERDTLRRKLRFMDSSIKYETVFLRGDCNVPLENGNITDNSRIVALLPTIRELLSNKNKVVLASHLGRPKRYDQALSMLVVANQLARLMPDVHIVFCADEEPYTLCSIINDMECGRSVLVIENLRFYEGEAANDPRLAKALAMMATVFVNDAFGCLHRKHASIVGIAGYLPSYAGLLIKKELEQIDLIMGHSRQPSMAIMGGSKISTKAPALKNVINVVDKVVVGGGIAHYILKLYGYNIGKSLVEDVDDPELVACLLRNRDKIILPTDVVVTKDPAASAILFREVMLENIEEDDVIVDLGRSTTLNIIDALQEMRMVIWNGPLGFFEKKPFDLSSVTVAREIASLTSKQQMHSIIGGGDVVHLITSNALTQFFSHVSTGGGALLEVLGGVELPGLLVLRDGT